MRHLTNSSEGTTGPLASLLRGEGAPVAAGGAAVRVAVRHALAAARLQVPHLARRQALLQGTRDPALLWDFILKYRSTLRSVTGRNFGKENSGRFIHFYIFLGQYI